MSGEKKIKVALVYLGRKGGGPVYSLEIAKQLQHKADLACVISAQVDNLASWQKDVKGITLVKTYTNFLEFSLSFLDLPRFLALRRKIKELNPDVLYFPFFHFYLPLISWWFKGIPQVYTAHDPVLHSGEKSSLTSVLQNKLIQKSQRVIILSSAFKKDIPKSADRVDVIPHGIFDYYLEQVQDQSEKPHPPTLLFFGRIVDYKGLDLLLKAFPIVQKALPQACLLIAGSGNLEPYQNLLKGQKGIILENKWIDDQNVAGYFLQSDILVCPYRDASQSGAIPVAYVFKMPVIATRVGGLIEQVEDQKTGILVEGGNVEKIAQACIRLLQNEDQRKRFGQAGYQKATTQWSWEGISDQVLTSLKKAMRNS
ncbi:MAG: glycosyltransferase family 4 protein [Candidatus Gribaldobacteria bacterium]|nr:glycosyltransferase family 4 protein [Candidatus Gribaldobacteria bacterium]